MTRLGETMARGFMKLGPSILPFADAATVELPMGRLLRLALFQVTVGMAAVLLIGTLNRVMIVELEVPAWIVAVMLSLPLVFAPFRALVGFRSDTHRSVLGWRRVPYIWFGTLLQFGGLAIMPFALLILSGDTTGPTWPGHVAAALAFVLVGAGLHTTQTVGLALATDLAPAHVRPKVVALLCVMLLLGMLVSAVVFGLLLADFSALRLIKVIQGAAVVTIVLNGIALWKQEARDPSRTDKRAPRQTFSQSWAAYANNGLARRRLVATGLGTAAFSMQDILLEPYGGQILHLPVAATTALTAMLAAGGGLGLLLAARWLGRGGDAFRVAAAGAGTGILAFSAVIFAAPLNSIPLFALGVTLIGLGGGLFAHGTLTASMAKAGPEETGLALGAWGAVQASAAGVAIAASGILRDLGSYLATSGALGEGMNQPSTGYLMVYHLEIALLFATLVAIGPLVRDPATRRRAGRSASPVALPNPSA
ncbi:BCD family MFS transporter [Methylobacterium sp. Leaf100]|uniref:BCD family MFS transporter n=1 Tax=Methylobacterium sp. Leaf100 TaxID=1736252 RepID=UPI0006FEC8A6|nr:BCD family MFS transporter [Methylobacterium sp. Leaf100]KQP18632.1 protein pucC [Methylobacterium sp. Leaf100]